jgi:hypothetical protein
VAGVDRRDAHEHRHDVSDAPARSAARSARAIPVIRADSSMTIGMTNLVMPRAFSDALRARDRRRPSTSPRRPRAVCGAPARARTASRPRSGSSSGGPPQAHGARARSANRSLEHEHGSRRRCGSLSDSFVDDDRNDAPDAARVLGRAPREGSPKTKNRNGALARASALCALWARAPGAVRVRGGRPQVHSAPARSAERALEQEPMLMNGAVTRIAPCDALDAPGRSDVMPFETCAFAPVPRPVEERIAGRRMRIRRRARPAVVRRAVMQATSGVATSCARRRKTSAESNCAWNQLALCCERWGGR